MLDTTITVCYNYSGIGHMTSSQKEVFFMEETEKQNIPQLYVIMPQELLCDKTLSIMAKLVYARISGFKEFFESAETTAEFFGKSADSIRRAKQELESRGFIECVSNNGRGKSYRVSKIAQADYAKLPNQTMQNCRPYNKDYNKEEIKDTLSKDKGLEAEVYGNEQVNKAFDIWNEIIGLPQKETSSYNRHSAYNIMRAKDKGEQWLIGMLKCLHECQKDKFAPKEARNIANFQELERNWEHLMMWYRQKKVQQQAKDEQTVDLKYL